MKKRTGSAFLPLFSALALLAASNCFALPASTGWVLMKSPSARSLSMAEAFSSLGGDVGGVAAVHYNPASLAFLQSPEVSLIGQNGKFEEVYGSMISGFPTRLGNFSGAFSYYSIPDIELTDLKGNTRTGMAEQDLVCSFSYGKKFGERLGLGFTAKYLSSKLVNAVSAGSFSTDFGAQLRFTRLSFGISARNTGGKLKYANAEASLPTVIQGGVSYCYGMNSPETVHRLILSLDAVKEKGEDLQESAGAEFLWNGIIFFRAGGTFAKNANKYSFGMGFLLGNVQVDYSRMLNDEFDMSQSISVGYKFGND